MSVLCRRDRAGLVGAECLYALLADVVQGVERIDVVNRVLRVDGLGAVDMPRLRGECAVPRVAVVCVELLAVDEERVERRVHLTEVQVVCHTPSVRGP